MKNTQLEQFRAELVSREVGMAIAEMDVYLQAWPQPQSKEVLNGIKADYDLMVDYWRRGVEDPRQDEMYQHLLQRLYVLYANIMVFRRIQQYPMLTRLYSEVKMVRRRWSLALIREELEGFVSSVAMLELEPEHLRQTKSDTVYREHQQFMDQLFNYLLVSHSWSEGVGNDFEDLLTTPTVDSIDQQLMASAITLSALNQFDMVKFRLLVNVYRRAVDEQVRQRALTGWALLLSAGWMPIYPEQAQIVTGLLSSEKVCQELTELQIQIIYCLDSERDTQTIEKEIMPDLLKNGQIRVTRNGIEELEEDQIEDILHPDIAEERMEKLEQSITRMMDMQKEGADIYYGGFSQMKRFAFFNRLSNWFVPFYLQHPDMKEYVNDENLKLAHALMSMSPFCNSDQYSFLLASRQVLAKLPKNLRDIIGKGEIALASDVARNEEKASPAYIRRLYLMDLYRFFRLHPARNEFSNPFMVSNVGEGACLFFCLPVFTGSPLESYKDGVIRLMKRKKMNDPALNLLDSYSEEHHNVQYYLWQYQFEKALALDPQNEKALAGRARELFDLGNYEEAVEAYDNLLLLYPDKRNYLLNKAVCLLYVEDYDEALKLLYHLNYDNPDDSSVNSVLAWTLTCAGRQEQAEKLYLQLLADDNPGTENYENYGYCLWFQGRIDEAASMFRKYLETTGLKATDFTFLSEDRLLRAHGISNNQKDMMRALVLMGDA